MKRSLVLLVALPLLLAGTQVQAQEQQAAPEVCLSTDEVKQILADRRAWPYATYGQTLLETASCVMRESARILRYRHELEKNEVRLELIGSDRFAFWNRILKVAAGEEVFADRKAAGLPPARMIYAAIQYLPWQTLFVVKFTPPVKRISVAATIEYQVALWASASTTLPSGWPTTEKYIRVSYRPRPSVLPDGTITDPFLFNSERVSRSEAEVFSRIFSPLVIAYIRDGFLDRQQVALVSQ